MVNPTIVELSEETQDGDEGCLSVPGIWAPTVRAMHAVVEGFDVDGKPLRLEGTGLMARCLQHEVDHLDGKLFLDRLTGEAPQGGPAGAAVALTRPLPLRAAQRPRILEPMTSTTPRRALLLENIHPTAADALAKAGFEVERVDRALEGDELLKRLDGVQVLGIRSGHPGTGRRHRAGRRPAGGRRVLHRHQPDRPQDGDRARRRRLQRAVLQHPQRGGAGDRRDHLADAADDRAQRQHARRRLGEVGQGQPRAARPQPGHHRLRQHRQPAVGARRGAWACGSSSTTPPTSSRWATRSAAPRSTSCSRPPTSSRCTSTGGRATAACSARSSFRRMRPGSIFLNLSRGFVVDQRGAAPAHRQRAHLRCRPRRVPGGARRGRRPVRVRAARAEERHPHPAHRRVDRGGAAGHRRRSSPAS